MSKVNVNIIAIRQCKEFPLCASNALEPTTLRFVASLNASPAPKTPHATCHISHIFAYKNLLFGIVQAVL